jgi:CubicO group peptidase (beta-lactamase class C family)
LAKRRIEKWVVIVLSVVGLVPAAILGLYVFMTLTATPLHPDAQGVPASSDPAPAAHWVAAVDQGRRIVREGLVAQNLPGVSVAVGVGGEIVWAEGFGWADLEKRVPVTPDTKFRIGTASTALTSAAAGLLLEQGRLKLDDPIQAYVPEYPRKPWPVTLRQVMGHTAGVGNDSGDEGPLFAKHCARPVEALQAFGEDALRFEPGTEYRFSRYSWILVSAAIEAAAKEPFFLFMQKQVFEPLGMHATTSDSLTEPIEHRAAFYFPAFAADPRYGLDPMRDLDYSCYAGSSAFLSTPSDLVRFSTAMGSGKLLKLETVRLLQTSGRLASGTDTGYGLGWDLERLTLAGVETQIAGHDGDSLAGNVASLWTFPEHGLVVGVTSNASYADTPGLALTIAQIFAAARASDATH